MSRKQARWLTCINSGPLSLGQIQDGKYLKRSGNQVVAVDVPAGEGGGPHTHAISDVTGLQAELDGKQASGSYAASDHNHDAAYSASGHNHDAAYAAIDHTHPGGGSGPDVKSGLVNLGAGATVNVTFTTPFSSTPHVTHCSQFNGADTSTTIYIYNVTANGFTMKGAGNAAGNVAWIATNAGNT